MAALSSAALRGGGTREHHIELGLLGGVLGVPSLAVPSPGSTYLWGSAGRPSLALWGRRRRLRGHRAAPWHRRHRRHRDSPGSLRWICWNMLRYQSRGRSTLCRDTTGTVRKGPEGVAEPGPTPPTHRARGDGHPRLIHRPDAVVLHPAPLPPLAVLGPCGRPARWARATGGGMWGCGSPRALHGVLSGCWGAGSLRLLGRPGLVPVGG